MERKKICAFFGHSTVHENISDKLEQAIRTAIEDHGVENFWCGGYGEFDSMAARAAHDLKTEYPDIEVILVRAYMPKNGEKLSDIYDDSIYPEGLETVPYRFAISRRNRWMAKNCDMAITYVNNDFGGAYKTYKMLKQQTVLQLGKYE